MTYLHPSDSDSSALHLQHNNRRVMDHNDYSNNHTTTTNNNNNNNYSTHSTGIELTRDDTATATNCHCPTNNNNNNNNNNSSSSNAAQEVDPAILQYHDHQNQHSPNNKSETTAWDAWIQLTKAYIGPGCLSLPWAVTQLGLPVGAAIICVVAFWTSYNCWNVVALKRIILQERHCAAAAAAAAAAAPNDNTDTANTSNNHDETHQQLHLQLHQQESHNHHRHHHHQQQQNTTSTHTHTHTHTNTHVTYPDVGEWAYNRKFKDMLLLSICVQQLAVCTVFLSFIGENIAAVMARTLVDEGEKAPSHAFVITLALPFALLLSCLPNLKVLSPVMVVATVSLFIGFGLLGVVMVHEWDHRPRPENGDINFFDIEWSQVPMAVCAILYSYEGICVILPVESAMAEPRHFQKVFVSSMSFTALVFTAVACLCVVAFGDVTNGSVTAFLVEHLQDETVKWWLYMTNTACSVAVLLTYPLQLFPCFELTGPWMTRMLRLDVGTHVMVHLRGGSHDHNHHRHGHYGRSPLRSFSPIPSCENPDDGIVGNHEYHHHQPTTTETPPSSSSSSTTTTTKMPPRDFTTTLVEGGLEVQQDQDDNNNEESDDDDDEVEEIVELDPNGGIPFLDAAFPTPGDSPQLRAILVCFTYIMAIAIPNVQLLVSLAGALSGSLTGLIIPPLLELAYVKRQEKEIVARTSSNLQRGESNNFGDDENEDDDHDNDDCNDNSVDGRMAAMSSPTRRSLSRLRWKKWECYFLCSLGVVICVFGTGAALADIVRVYMGP